MTLEVYKEGYTTVELSALIQAGQTTPLPVITLELLQDTTATDTSGSAAAIALISMIPETLSVAGAGGNTSSYIVCEVRDVKGNPVDSLHAAQVNFSLVENPGGGAYLYPITGVTNDLGRITTTFYSGTSAGIAIVNVQVAGGGISIVLPEIVIYETGEPASINLISLQFDSVAVKGIGANEASTAIFVVRDAGRITYQFARGSHHQFRHHGQSGRRGILIPRIRRNRCSRAGQHHLEQRYGGRFHPTSGILGGRQQRLLRADSHNHSFWFSG